jgi:16S rRNA (guanine(966)-N(2))-methyltransferase RsmD
VRIIAGELKGRKLDAPDWTGLRPTSDKLRETLFNVLGPRVVGARVLDGYAGTGAVGIEALSRGALHVTFVDSDPRAAGLIKANLSRCRREEGYAIIAVDFAAVSGRLAGQIFDIIFLDPPYGSAGMSAALATAARLASAGTRAILEHARRDLPPAQVLPLVLTRTLTSGDSGLAFYERMDVLDR